MARPPIDGEAKGDVLRIRLTDTERAEIDRAANGVPTSTWARAELLRLARRINEKTPPAPKGGRGGKVSKGKD